MHVEITPVNYEEMTSARVAESSEKIRARVIQARNLQIQRFEGSMNIHCNAMMGSELVKKVCQLNEVGQQILKHAMEKLQLSARAYDRILKVARTIADLDVSIDIESHHIAEAITYRNLDRENWAG